MGARLQGHPARSSRSRPGAAPGDRGAAHRRPDLPRVDSPTQGDRRFVPNHRRARAALSRAGPVPVRPRGATAGPRSRGLLRRGARTTRAPARRAPHAAERKAHPRCFRAGPYARPSPCRARNVPGGEAPVRLRPRDQPPATSTWPTRRSGPLAGSSRPSCSRAGTSRATASRSPISPWPRSWRRRSRLTSSPTRSPNADTHSLLLCATCSPNTGSWIGRIRCMRAIGASRHRSGER